jgi:hypothetical protein
VAWGGGDLKLEMPNCIRVEIRWNTITASDAIDWPFSQNGRLGPVFQDETRRGPQIYRFLAMETLAKAITGEFEEDAGVAHDKVAAFVSDALQFISARMGDTF